MPDQTATQIDAQCRAFFAAIHKRIKHRPHSRMIFRKLRRLSERDRTDQWSVLAGYEGNGVKKGSILSQLKVHFAATQQNRCCYCRTFLQNISHAKPIEHVLPRSDYPQFSMHYFNLALACYTCNEAKKAQNWSSLPSTVRRYYRRTAPSTYFHPRFHDYDEHIVFDHRGNNRGAYFIYFGRSPIGKHLCRNLLATVAQQMMLVHNNAALDQAVATMRDFNDEAHPLDLPALQTFYRTLDRTICGLA